MGVSILGIMMKIILLFEKSPRCRTELTEHDCFKLVSPLLVGRGLQGLFVKYPLSNVELISYLTTLTGAKLVGAHLSVVKSVSTT